MECPSPVLVTSHLTKKYGPLAALDDFSITLERGRILGLIGPNGAGKTTAVRILVGQARPTSGTATIAGADCTRDAKRIKRLVGYMPEMFGLYDNMRVHEYLDFFGAAFGIPRRKRVKRVEEVMETTGCTWLRDRYLESLSYGMRQRVGIARTMIHDPEILILDEPANGLDPKARIEMREILLRLAAMGKTLIVTSHILPELSRICDRLAILVQGRLRAFGRLDEIFRQVSERRMVEVQLSAADDAERAAEVIRHHERQDSEVVPSPAEAMVRFRTSLRDEELAAILAELIRAGLNPSQFREVPMDLEDTFLSIVGEVDSGLRANGRQAAATKGEP
jgi:ABC-2 type transport system ATP-binding protein